MAAKPGLSGSSGLKLFIWLVLFNQTNETNQTNLMNGLLLTGGLFQHPVRGLERYCAGELVSQWLET